VGHTSGLEFTSHFDIALYPGIIFSLFPLNKILSIASIIKVITIILVAYSSTQTFSQARNLYESIFLRKVEPPYFFNFRILGDRVKKYSGALTVPSQKCEIPYVLVSGDLLTP
jgi:hypothetical protein